MSTFSHTRALLNHDVVVMKERSKFVFITLNRRHVLADSREGEGGAIGGSDSIWGRLGVNWGSGSLCVKQMIVMNYAKYCFSLRKLHFKLSESLHKF